MAGLAYSFEFVWPY